MNRAIAILKTPRHYSAAIGTDTGQTTNPALLTRLKESLKLEMRARNKLTVNVIKSCLADIQTAEKSGLYTHKQLPVAQIMQTSIKKRRESAEAYRDGGRDDLAKAEEAEVQILGGFLPTQMTKAEIGLVVEQAIKELEGKKVDVGSVMKIVSGKFDVAVAPLKFVSDVVREKLKGL
jgi:uncharacterized protein